MRDCNYESKRSSNEDSNYRQKTDGGEYSNWKKSKSNYDDNRDIEKGIKSDENMANEVNNDV
jgi:hypothetical protein